MKRVHLALFALMLAASALLAKTDVAVAAVATSIDVCCPWNAKLADGDLTYKISGASGATLTAMLDAVENWETETGITLTPATGRTKPDIALKFKTGGGSVQGQALRKFDSNGFVTSVNINVSGMAFGIDVGAVHQITMHEMGHALGAGHANGDGVLMSPTINGGVDGITSCDRAAVLAAQNWYFEDPSSPTQPSVTSVSC